MLSVSLDNSGSPKKRTLSRSEDESLRSIIQESESSSRRLTRSDSRPGTLKRRPDSQQSDQDLSMGLPEMLELQASYEEAVHELRGLEVEREALLFQVDVLQDTLESVEELLAETQREAGQANAELAQEREAKRKLEHLVHSLMQEVEMLKEERNSHMHILEHTNETEVNTRRQGCQMNDPVRSTFTGEAAAPSEDVHPAKEDEGSVVTKVKWMTNPAPSFALDEPLHGDGVHRRPYDSGNEGGRDRSPDKSDSDTASTYEDASADTPQRDEPLELPHDSASKDNTEPQNGPNCLLS